MKRRANNEGSIYFSDREHTWIAEVTLPNGKRKKKRNKRQNVVKDWLFEQRKAIKENNIIVDEHISVADYLKRYLETSAKHKVKPSTFSAYRRDIEGHILPELGKIKLSALTPHQIQDLYNKKLKDGLSKKSVLNIHGVLRTALNQAVKLGLLIQNPCTLVTPPRPEKTLPSIWTVEQSQLFLDAVEDHRYYLIYLIALTTGARRGEILGLEWQNISWENSTISIQKSVNEVEGKAMVGDTKTKRSRRIIALPQLVIDNLKAKREESGDNSGFIFKTSKNTIILPRNLLRHFHSVLDRIDIPRIRFHDMRHTAATILLQQGVHPKKVQELLGHSSIVLTLDTYSHIIPTLHNETAKKMNELFSQ